MAEPISSTTASASVATVALLAMFPGVDASVVLGAFSGSVVFVLASDELTVVKKVGYLLAAFGAGILAAQMTAGILSAIIPGAVAVSPGVGALLAATLVIKTLLWLLDRNLGELIDLVRGRRPE
ncbi:MAG: putative holin [Sterolibacterium sp.]|nr:putative holin [Sterolibacterium sp.]